MAQRLVIGAIISLAGRLRWTAISIGVCQLAPGFRWKCRVLLPVLCKVSVHERIKTCVWNETKSKEFLFLKYVSTEFYVCTVIQHLWFFTTKLLFKRYFKAMQFISLGENELNCADAKPHYLIETDFVCLNEKFLVHGHKLKPLRQTYWNHLLMKNYLKTCLMSILLP